MGITEDLVQIQKARGGIPIIEVLSIGVGEMGIELAFQREARAARLARLDQAVNMAMSSENQGENMKVALLRLIVTEIING